jgi:DNA end-binding protein Ku
MARSLMDAVTVDFRPEKQHDAYRHALEQVLAGRLEGMSPRTAPETVQVEGGGVVDLMAALEQSVEAAKSRRRTRRAATKTAKKTKPKAPGNPPTG